MAGVVRSRTAASWQRNSQKTPVLSGGFGEVRMPGLGRKPKITNSKIESAKRLLASGVSPKCVAKNLGVSIPTLYRWVPASAHA